MNMAGHCGRVRGGERWWGGGVGGKIDEQAPEFNFALPSGDTKATGL
jgi:hypothetical protein